MDLANKKCNKPFNKGFSNTITNNQFGLNTINRQLQWDELKTFLEETIDKKIKEYIAEAHPIYYTREEASKYLNVSLSTLDKFIKIGIIKSSRIGKSIRISKENLENSLQEIKSLR
jgi:excisionase family DNA binding protein